MHTKSLWILWLRASQSVDNGIHGSHGRKYFRPQCGSTVRCFFLAFFCLIIPSMDILIVVSYWKNFVLFTNMELYMEIFGLPTSCCRMDLMLILLISRMHTNINAR